MEEICPYCTPVRSLRFRAWTKSMCNCRGEPEGAAACASILLSEASPRAVFTSPSNSDGTNGLREHAERLEIPVQQRLRVFESQPARPSGSKGVRSEEHTSELQS